MKRLAIEDLHLDLRGVDRATAEAAARRIGPALARAFAGRVILDSSKATTASRVATDGTTDAGTLASTMAGQIARATSRSRS
jgi:hypothetical protein